MKKDWILLFWLLCIPMAGLAQGNVYQADIIAQGFGNQSLDLSAADKVELEQPRLAYVNLISAEGMPGSPTSNLHDSIEYYDPETDTYFAKRVIANLQGQSSTAFMKRNVAIDFCEDEWKGEVTPDIDFKGWVKQDAFHLKANYIDWLRGVGIVGYHLYDEMEQTLPEAENRMWKRAGVDAKKNARCYPDGFPCMLYLNGEPYGIYVWQLKKHRRNMGQDKDVMTHIHLDGFLSDDNFWQGKINWTAFEVRNPKNLVTKDCNPYNGHRPSELGASVVKDAIVRLSKHCQQLQTMDSSGVDEQEIRQYISRYFDIQSVTDYIVFGLMVSNYDGFQKNWQWLTYDGEKWFVAPYDLDCTFGNYHEGTFVFPARLSYINSTYTMAKSRVGIIKWMWAYYYDEIAARYCELRSRGVFDADHIVDLLYDWYYRIGDEHYAFEWGYWFDSYCISETVVNDGWAATEDWPVYYGLPKWNAETTYRTGDRCALDGRVWRATATTEGVRPYIQLGYTDSLDRLEQWVRERVELEDGYLGYYPIVTGVTEMADDGDREGPGQAEYYTLDGIKHRDASSGINVMRHRDGRMEKVIISTSASARQASLW